MAHLSEFPYTDIRLSPQTHIRFPDRQNQRNVAYYKSGKLLLLLSLHADTDMTIKVLLVDDHGIVRDGLKSLLNTQPDMEVIGEAADGREALHQLSATCPDVMILDIAMPVLDGLGVVPVALEICPRCRVIVLSAHCTYDHVFGALQAGVSGYLVKEAAGAELFEAIRTVYTGHHFLTGKIMDMVLDSYVSLGRLLGPSDALAKLSPRERELLQLVVQGKSHAAIADTLVISPKTAEVYRSRLMQKLGIRDSPGLVKFAIAHGLTTAEFENDPDRDLE